MENYLRNENVTNCHGLKMEAVNPCKRGQIIPRLLWTF